MATLSWEPGVGGNWSTPGSWSNNTAVSSGDFVIAALGIHTVTIGSPELANSVTLNASVAILDLSAAPVVGTTMAIDEGTLLLSGEAPVWLNPKSAGHLVGLALALIDPGERSKEMTCLPRAIGLEPKDGSARLAPGQMPLAQGEMPPGWKECEWRTETEAGVARQFLGLVDHSALLTDFGETAAWMACLNLVITVDTSVAYSAGTMGRPAFVLLARPSNRRWLLDRSDTPWYPSLRPFRQPAPGAWDEPIAAVATALREFSGPGFTRITGGRRRSATGHQAAGV